MARVRSKNNIVRMPNSETEALQLAGSSSIRSEDIARRAYEIYERRGGTHGADLDDWLQAEQELRGESAGQRPA